MTERSCKYEKCGQRFAPKQHNQVYCTTECCDAYYEAKSTTPAGGWGTGECRECGASFHKKCKVHLFCCHEHSQQFHRRANKEAYEARKVKEHEVRCKVCDEMFVRDGYTASKVYCSAECRRTYYKVARDTLHPPRTCWSCHATFEPQSAKQKFCSSGCLIRAARPRTHYKIFERDGFACGYCGASPLTDKGVELTLDHVRPYSVSGDDSAANILTACKFCNTEKSSVLLRPDEEKRIIGIVEARNEAWGINPSTKLSFLRSKRRK